MATIRGLISASELLAQWSPDELAAHVNDLSSAPSGGCDACRFADPLSDRLCTVPDISAEDFDLGVSGINCSRFQPRRGPAATARPPGALTDRP
jgi:hypothetical protein